MSSYTGDAATMTEIEPLNALKQLAWNWCDKPHLKDDWSEGTRYGELRLALKDRFGVEVHVLPVGGSTNY